MADLLFQSVPYEDKTIALYARLAELECPFCNADLEEVYAYGELDCATRCASCGAVIIFTTDTENVEREVAEAVMGKDFVTEREISATEIRVVLGIDTLTDGPGGDVIGYVHLVAARPASRQ